MKTLRAFLVAIKVEEPQRESSIIVFAKNIAEVEAKVDAPLLRIKIMDWVPISSDSPEVEDGSRYVLVEYKKNILDKTEEPKLFVIKAKKFSDIDDKIRYFYKSELNTGYILQGIETLDLDVQE